MAIPSVGHAGYDPAHVRASAELTREILASAGARDARLIELDGGHPAVFGEIPGPVGAPTVLLYAHHDVQPEGDAAAWTSPPFCRRSATGGCTDGARPTTRAASRCTPRRCERSAHGGRPPVTVKVLVEGEEECATEHLPELVRGHTDLLRADVAVIADGGNVRTGVPTVDTSVRGVADCTITVSVMPIARTAASTAAPSPTRSPRSAGSRHAARRRGRRGDRRAPRLPWEGSTSPRTSAQRSGLYDEVRLIGSGPIADRLLSKPAVAVLGFDAPRVAESSNQIVPHARARVSLRLAPGDDPVAAREALVAHLRAAAPWGVRVDIGGDGEAGMGYMVDTSTSAYAAAKEALAEAFGAAVESTGAAARSRWCPCSRNLSRHRRPDLGPRRREVQLALAGRERGPRRRGAPRAGRSAVLRTSGRWNRVVNGGRLAESPPRRCNVDVVMDEPTAPPETPRPDVVQAVPVDAEGRSRAKGSRGVSAETITEPAKLLRIASMVRELLDETRQASLDEAGRRRLAEIYQRAVERARRRCSPPI